MTKIKLITTKSAKVLRNSFENATYYKLDTTKLCGFDKNNYPIQVEIAKSVPPRKF